MVYGLIISAGNETRFASDTPKALSRINGVPLLTMNCNRLLKVCDSVLVIVSRKNKGFFGDYSTIEIDSGFGCGDAVWKALKSLHFNEGDRCIVQWGDCFPSEEVYAKMISCKDDYDVLIPAQYEESPYVEIEADGKGRAKKVLFSKYGETKGGKALHDLSVFCINPASALGFMDSFHASKWDSERCCYSSKHGNEFQFLDLVNDTGINAKVMVVDGVRNIAFNTVQELDEIRKEYLNQ